MGDGCVKCDPGSDFNKIARKLWPANNFNENQMVTQL